MDEKYYKSYSDNSEREKQQDSRTKQNMEILDSFFNGDYNSSVKPKTVQHENYTTSSYDDLEKTKEIDNVELKELKELVAKLREINEEDNEEITSNQSQEKGKTLTKALPGYNKLSEDVNQIVESFIPCFILALVTATIGTGWLLYLINHL